MSKWFRWYEGTTEDGKFRMVARNASVTVATVIGVWAALLEDAAHEDHRGVVVRDAELLGAVLDLDEEVVRKILEAMKRSRLITCDASGIEIAKWKDRQYESDSSSERVKKYRERRKANGLPQQQWWSKGKKEAILAKTGGACVYCNTTENITIDHATPLHRGGSDDIDNLQPACRSCNADKRNMTHDEYLAWPGRATFRAVNVTLQKRPQNTEPEAEPKSERNTHPSVDVATREADGRTDDPFFVKCKLALNGTTERAIDIVRNADGVYGTRSGAAQWLAELIDDTSPDAVIQAIRFAEAKRDRREIVANPKALIAKTAQTAKANAAQPADAKPTPARDTRPAWVIEKEKRSKAFLAAIGMEPTA